MLFFFFKLKQKRGKKRGKKKGKRGGKKAKLPRMSVTESTVMDLFAPA